MANIVATLAYGFLVHTGYSAKYKEYPAWVKGKEDVNLEESVDNLIIEITGIKVDYRNWLEAIKTLRSALGVTIVKSGFDVGEELSWTLVVSDSIKEAEFYEPNFLGTLDVPESWDNLLFSIRNDAPFRRRKLISKNFEKQFDRLSGL